MIKQMIVSDGGGYDDDDDNDDEDGGKVGLGELIFDKAVKQMIVSDDDGGFVDDNDHDAKPLRGRRQSRPRGIVPLGNAFHAPTWSTFFLFFYWSTL